MAKSGNDSIDEILKSIREAIIDKEQKKYFAKFMPLKNNNKEAEEDEIFVLSRNMMVKREDIPYQLGVWSFDDVAMKIMKKYKTFFINREQIMKEAEITTSPEAKRVQVKEN